MLEAGLDLKDAVLLKPGEVIKYRKLKFIMFFSPLLVTAILATIKH